MRKLKLTRSWGPRKAGTVVEVDDARADRLRAQRLGEYAPDKTAVTKPRRGALAPNVKT